MSTTLASHSQHDVVLRTGRTLLIRPIQPDDRDALMNFYKNLSPESVHSRFFDLCTPDIAVNYAINFDARRDFGLIAEVGEEIAGVAHYFSFKGQPEVAEVAFAVADDAQGTGIASKLLESLVGAARESGIERFEAEALAENRAMIEVFRSTGFNVKSRSTEDTVHLSFPIAATATSDDRSAERSQTAAHASMRPVFAPRSIAVIGASRRPGQLGNQILRNLLSSGYTGSLFAVNRNATEIEGVRAYPSMAAIGETVDLAIIAVPANEVDSVVDTCIEKKVSAVVIISAGFGETGDEGRAHQNVLLEKIRAAGIRMVGPNCMGVINTDPTVKMHATFSPIFPPPGNVAMSSQSGALGLAILDYATSLGIGFSTFISVGNKADVSGNDLIQYWALDPKTKVILLYLESFGNPRKFGQIARRVGREKPIVIVKAGRSISGARAASSHTGALATNDAIVDDLVRQSGVIRTDTLEEMFDVTALLANQPLPNGNRVAIVTNAGGPGILAADACEASGLQLAKLTDATTNALREFLPAAASVGNPVDMIASASASDYERALRLVLEDPGVDSVIAIYIPIQPGDMANIAGAIRGSAETANIKPLMATFMSAHEQGALLRPIPAFPFPERTVRALAHATRYAEWRRQPAGHKIEFADIDRRRARSIIDDAVARNAEWLTPEQVRDLLNAVHIHSPAMEIATTTEEALEAAMRIGFPVALKAWGPDLIHKTEAGGVKLALKDEWSVCVAFDTLKNSLGDLMEAVVVQQMIPGGVEMMLGATLQGTFGHVIGCGAGGTLVELLGDVAFRIHPLTDVDAADLLAEVRASKLLRGYRGSAPVDEPALRDAILRLSALLDICPEICELDLNPVKVLEHGAVAVDARVRLGTDEPQAPSRRIAY